MARLPRVYVLVANSMLSSAETTAKPVFTTRRIQSLVILPQVRGGEIPSGNSCFRID